MSQAWNSFTTWLHQPFKSDMDFKGWALFTGLIIIVALLWFYVLGHVFEKVAKEL